MESSFRFFSLRWVLFESYLIIFLDSMSWKCFSVCFHLKGFLFYLSHWDAVCWELILVWDFFFFIEKICISSWPSTICWSCLPFPSALCRHLHYKLSSCMWELYVRVCFWNLYSVSSFCLPLCQYRIVLVLYCYNGSGYLVLQVFQKHCFSRLLWPFLGCFSI